MIRHSAARCLVPVQLKHNLFSLRYFFRSATPTTLPQSTDLCSLDSQYTHGRVFHSSCLEFNILSHDLGNLGGGLNGCFHDGGFSWSRSSSDFGGFLTVHFRNASTSWLNFHSYQSSLVLSKSPLIPSNLFSVILT